MEGGKWTNAVQNFDNTFNAMFSLFQLMTTEGWIQMMYQGIDSVGINMQPKLNANYNTVFYFIIYMIIGSQFSVNLFVGVIIDNFNMLKVKEELNNESVTEQQKLWIEIQKVAQNKKLKKAYEIPQGWRGEFYKFISHRYFEHTITIFRVAEHGHNVVQTL